MQTIMIGTTPITDLIVDGTYKMDAKDQYESWKDGNYREHRVIVTSKVEGSFDVVLPSDGTSLADFMEIIRDNEVNGVITALVDVTNRGSAEAISAYYELDNKEHNITASGRVVDVVTVKLKER
jgi:hypothetical protein